MAINRILVTDDTVANNAALTALTVATGLVDKGVYRTRGRSTERDGGEGVWVYASSATASANSGTILAIDGGGAGRFFRNYDDEVNIRWFPVAGDGVTDDGPAIAAADATGKGIVFPAGAAAHLVSTDITIVSQCRFEPGAKLVAPDGVTITLRRTPVAGAYQIFSFDGSGAVLFDDAAEEEGPIEWFGVTPSNGDPDPPEDIDQTVKTSNVLAHTKATASGIGVLTHSAYQYWFNSRVHIQTPHVELRGVSKFPHQVDHSTVYYTNNGHDDVIFVGFDSDPGGTDYHLEGVVIRNIGTSRSVPVDPVALGDEWGVPCGIRFRFTTFCYAIQCSLFNNQIGWLAQGTIRSYAIDCESTRTSPGSTSVNDFFWGFALDGLTFLIAAGGNASSYIKGCTVNVSPGVTLTENVGCELRGAFVDTYIKEFETSGVSTPIRLNGAGGMSDTYQRAGNADVLIEGCVLDAYSDNGILLHDLSDWAIVKIANNYMACASAVSGAAIQVLNSGGEVLINNNEALGWPNAMSSGLVVVNSSGVQARNNAWMGFDKPEEWNTASHFTSHNAINNPEEAASQAAVSLTGCSFFDVAPSVKGGATVFPAGVNCASTGNANGVIDTVGIDPAAVTGGVSNKLIINSIQIDKSGWWGSILVAGKEGLRETGDILQETGAFLSYKATVDPSNNERGFLRWETDDFVVGAEAQGSGVLRNLQLKANRVDFHCNGALRWFVNSDGNILSNSDGSFKIGDEGAFRPQAVFASQFVRSQYLKIDDGMTAPSATSGQVKIYVDAADGDLKVIFGDGVVKTLAIDS